MNKKINKTEIRKNLAKQEAKKKLKDFLSKTKDNKIYCVLRHVSKSGMQRTIHFFTIVNDEIYHLDYLISKALDLKPDQKREGLKIRGAGMDMGFDTIYNLSVSLYCPGKEYNQEKAYKLKSEWI